MRTHEAYRADGSSAHRCSRVRGRWQVVIGLALGASLGTSLIGGAASSAAQVRGYELVTPADDGQYDVSVPWSNIETPLAAGAARRSTSDGQHVVFTLNIGGVGVGDTLPGVAPDGEINDYGVASRAESGWGWSVPLGDRSSVGGCFIQGEQLEFDTISEDAGRLLVRAKCNADKSELGGGLDHTVVPEQTLYAADVASSSASFVGAWGGSDGLIARPAGGGAIVDNFVGGSADLSTVYFASPAALLPGVPDLTDVASAYLYRWSAGVTELVTRTATGVPFAVWAEHRIDTEGTDSGGLERPHTVSEDGSAVTLTVPRDRRMVAEDANSVTDVYQIRGGETTWVSRPTRSPAATPAPRLFQGASASGDKVVFTTAEAMTGDDQDSRKDLYVADLASDQLTRVSTGPLNDNADEEAAAAHFVTLSDDGSHVYFISGSQLVAEDGDGGASLYVRNLSLGTTSHVAPATNPIDGDPATAHSLADERTPFSGKWIDVTPDGQTAFISLATDVTLPGGRGGVDTDGMRDLFVWREDDGLRRVRQGVDADANTSSLPGLGCFGQTQKGVGFPVPCRAMTDTGGLVFFETTDALVPADANVSLDVYGMSTADGSVELISPPRESDVSSVSFVDTSASGHHVFFLTRDTLDPERDLDGGRADIYNARIGDVFGPPPRPERCAPSVDCTSAPQAPPTRATLASDRLGPVDDVFPRARRVISVRRPGRSTLRRAARTGVLFLTVRTSAAGRIAAVSKARLNGKLRTVASGQERLSTDESGRLMLRLSAQARQWLRGGKRLRMTVRVRASGAKTEALTLVLRRSR